MGFETDAATPDHASVISLLRGTSLFAVFMPAQMASYRAQ